MMLTDQIVEEPPLPGRVAQGQPDLAAVRASLTDLEQQARTVISERPVVAVLVAFGVGYLVARLFSRATR